LTVEIVKLEARLAHQAQYIAELEKQLDHAVPGLVKEVREWVEVNFPEKPR
jgi:uncharacterized coiled-coil protein SlyX